METSPLFELHTEHLEQINRLKFYKDEIEIMRNRLSEIVQKNSSPEILSLVDRYENQFLIQENAIADLKHKIKAKQKSVELSITANPIAADHRKGEAERGMEEEVDTFEKNFNELRSEYIKFLSRRM
jgi:hypothetical protein